MFSIFLLILAIGLRIDDARCPYLGAAANVIDYYFAQVAIM